MKFAEILTILGNVGRRAPSGRAARGRRGAEQAEGEDPDCVATGQLSRQSQYLNANTVQTAFPIYFFH